MRTDPHEPDHTADEQAVAWVLHALEPDEESEFVEHLAGCARCAETVAETMSTMEVVARAVPQVDPPTDLRARVLAMAIGGEAPVADGDAPVAGGEVPVAQGEALVGERDVPVGEGDAPVAERDVEVPVGEGDAPVPAEHAPVAEGDAPVPAGDAPVAGDAPLAEGVAPTSEDLPPHGEAEPSETPPRDAGVVWLWRSHSVRRALLGAAAVLVVIVVGGLVAVNQSLQSERDAQIAASADSDRVVGVLRDAGTPGTVHATLAGPDGAMVGMVVDSGQGPRVLSTGLETNRSDQVYVLWGLVGAQPAAIGTFDISGQTPGVQSVPSQGQAGSFAGYAVSLEPGRTAPAAPTDIVASGQVGR